MKIITTTTSILTNNENVIRVENLLNIINIAEKDGDLMSVVASKVGLQQLAEEVRSDGKLLRAGGISSSFYCSDFRLSLLYADINIYQLIYLVMQKNSMRS